MKKELMAFAGQGFDHSETGLMVNSAATMNSLDFLNSIINPARVYAGENPHEPRKFLAKIEDELELDGTGKKFRLNNNQTKTAYYDLYFDQMMLVGMRESKAVRRSVLARLKDISPIPKTLPEALRLAADLEEQREQLENQLAIASPKADFVDRYVNASGSAGFREVAKLLSIREPVLRQFLIKHQIMYVLNGKMMPYANHLEAGRFTVKTGENQQNGHSFTQAKFTPKGINWLAGKLIKEGVIREASDA